MLAIFEAIAVTLWLTTDTIFYLFNFSYIGLSISLGLFLFAKKIPYARRIVQLLVGLYMLVYLGFIDQENMQLEGFWYYLFIGAFEASAIHYAVAKIFGPLIFCRQSLLFSCCPKGRIFPYQSSQNISCDFHSFATSTLQ